ncbi:hypothetical protein BSZ35_07205 [Salinibacter sp. 10B]|nr:hypothetical protein BSZ35_07205 [Salinibacter sp. 10B]
MKEKDCAGKCQTGAKEFYATAFAHGIRVNGRTGLEARGAGTFKDGEPDGQYQSWPMGDNEDGDARLCWGIASANRLRSACLRQIQHRMGPSCLSPDRERVFLLNDNAKITPQDEFNGRPMLFRFAHIFSIRLP